jgi:hypothetical protein
MLKQCSLLILVKKSKWKFVSEQPVGPDLKQNATLWGCLNSAAYKTLQKKSWQAFLPAF